MFNQKLRIMLSKGILTALLEVALIFVGITLAIAVEARDQLNCAGFWPVETSPKQLERLSGPPVQILAQSYPLQEAAFWPRVAARAICTTLSGAGRTRSLDKFSPDLSNLSTFPN